MEAVKKLQNSSKLLQKVIYPWRVARVWALPGIGSPDSAPPPNWMCSMLVGSEWGGEGRGGEMVVSLVTNIRKDFNGRNNLGLRNLDTEPLTSRFLEKLSQEKFCIWHHCFWQRTRKLK